MDIDAFRRDPKGGGKGAGKFTGACDKCGETGHEKAQCWAKGGGAYKQARGSGKGGKGNSQTREPRLASAVGATKACHKCGTTSNFAAG